MKFGPIVIVGIFEKNRDIKLNGRTAKEILKNKQHCLILEMHDTYMYTFISDLRFH